MNRSRLPGKPFWRFMVQPLTLVIARCRLPEMKWIHTSWHRLSVGWLGFLYLGGRLEFRLVLNRAWWKRW